MTDTAAAPRVDRERIASARVVPAAERRATPGPRTLRVLLQAGCSAALGVAGGLGADPLPVVVAGQALVIGILFLLPLLLGAEDAGVRRVQRFGLHGVVLSLLALPVLVSSGLEVGQAQVAVVAVLLVAGVLGRAVEAFRVAGTQLDAILDTLPPQQPRD